MMKVLGVKSIHISLKMLILFIELSFSILNKKVGLLFKVYHLKPKNLLAYLIRIWPKSSQLGKVRFA